MATARLRSPSPDTSNKRLKSNGTATVPKPTSNFAGGVLDQSNVQNLYEAYKQSQPFHYCLLDQLFQDELLIKVTNECNELRFTEKATDIYRVHQTGDLASLSYLPSEQQDLFPSIVALRDSLYSQEFRTFIRTVTGCGALSGTKQDMSINSYKTGCHLLNHDDVIGSRRVSYILYMPLPADKKWERSWGGSLELYPVDENGEPKTAPSRTIPPAWNQFIFFEVQPGRSFHSVEEVIVGGDGDLRDRLSISGWYHKAQEGEEGYEAEPAEREKSSLEQLSASSTSKLIPYPLEEDPPLPTGPLSEEHLKFLSQFLNPAYLAPKNLQALAKRFAAESSIQLHDFLNESLVASLQNCLRSQDAEDFLGPSRKQRIPAHMCGSSVGSPWIARGPPHKRRYCVLAQIEDHKISSSASATSLLKRFQNEFFPSSAFRAWLSLVSSLFLLSYSVEARRFRPGLDYTLATAEDEPRLDVILGLTPEVQVEGKGKAKEVADWETGEWGGWECYLAPSEEDDPAVYGSGHQRKPQNGNQQQQNGRESVDKGEDVNDADADENEDDDSTLLTVQPGFNRLLLVLRDPGVLRFVKYVSALAPGSRWDIAGEWEVGKIEFDDDTSIGNIDEDSEQDAEGEDDGYIES